MRGWKRVRETGWRHSPNGLAALQPRPHAARAAIVWDVGRGADAGARVHLQQHHPIHLWPHPQIYNASLRDLSQSWICTV